MAMVIMGMLCIVRDVETGNGNKLIEIHHDADGENRHV